VKVALHVGQLLQPVPGGIGRYVENIIDALPPAGVELVTFAAGQPTAHRAERWPHYVDLGPPRGALRYELWHRVRRPVLRFDPPVHVVHAPSLAIPPMGSTPLVVTIHDIAFLRHPEAFTKRGLEFHRRGLELAYHHASAYVVASRFAREELLRTGFPEDRITVAPHGISVAEPMPEEHAQRRLRQIAVEPPYLLSVATIEPRKGLPTLVAAHARLRRQHPDLSLVLVGKRGWLDVPGLEGPGVRELGGIDDDTLDVLYRHAEICAVPSRYEGFGLPPLEAMARGTAVVASDATSLPEVVGDAGLLVPPDDVDAWTDALGRLLDDQAERERLGRLGVERARTFTWSASADAHVAAYRMAVDRPRGRHR
jgi:glycosyltransferase involved in cell wall biosynthesis